MKLPAELRQTIYDDYFADIHEGQKSLCSADTPKIPQLAMLLPETKTETSIKALKRHLPLLHVNCEVRAEAGPILYNRYLANAEFPFNINYHNAADSFRRSQGIRVPFSACAIKTEA